MKLFGRLLIVLGIVAIIPGGLMVSRDLLKAREFDAKTEKYRAEREVARESLFDLNMEYRGYQQSVPTMPDSIKKAQSGFISKTYREYNKKIRSLEMQQKELTRLMGREQTKKEEALADTRLVGGGLGGGGLLLIVLGLILSRRGRRRGLGVDDA